jgi:hypothetical protein
MASLPPIARHRHEEKIEGDKDGGLISTVSISGPGPAGGPPEVFSYNLGVSMAQGLPPFQRRVCITVAPKYTVCNKTGLTMQVCPGKSLSRSLPMSASVRLCA